MYIIEVGKTYPYPNLSGGVDAPRLQPTNSFFDIVAWSTESKSDAIFWGITPLKLYPVIIDDIPIVVLSMPKVGFKLDVSLNIKGLGVEEDVNRWLANDGNIINLILVDANTNIVKGLRMVSVDFQEEVRTACKKQLASYDKTLSVYLRIKEISAAYSVPDLIAIYHKHKKK